MKNLAYLYFCLCILPNCLAPNCWAMEKTEKIDQQPYQIDNQNKQAELFLAIGEGQTEKVKELIIKDQSLVNIRFKYSNKTPLIFAIERGQAEIVKLLIQAGANLDLTDDFGRTPLIFAIRQRALVEFNRAQMLVETRENLITIKNSSTNKEITKAEEERYVKSLSLDNLSHRIYELKFSQIAQELIKAGVNLNHKDNNQHSSLFLALLFSQFDIAKLLMDAKAELTSEVRTLLINIYNTAFKYNDFETQLIFSPYLAASETSQNSILKNLLENKINLNKVNRLGQTPLMIAIIHNQIEIVKSLIEAEADLNCQDEFGETALTIALKNRQLEIVKLLLAAKAKITYDARQLMANWYYEACGKNDLQTQLYFSPYLSIFQITASLWKSKK